MGNITSSRRLVLALAAAWLAAPQARAAAPARILVVDAPDQAGLVQLDPSRVVAAQRAAEGISPQQAASQDFSAVQTALSDTLVQKITAMGLQAVRVPAGTQPAPGELAVVLQINAIDEGNRTRRTLIGFGAGQAVVQSGAMLLFGTASGPQMLQSFTASGSSGRMPGMGVGAAASGVKSAATAASGAAHGADELAKGPVGGEAVKAANQLARSIGQYFAAQNWISPAAVPSAGL